VYPSYMSRIVFAGLMLLGTGVSSVAQTQPPARFVGTVTTINVDTAEFTIKPDNAAASTVKLSSETVAERVEPGAKDLKSAQAMKASDIAVGDRVLVVLMPDSNVIRRIVDMSAVDITKRNDADRADWNKRGIAGVVAAKKDNEITLKMRSLQGEVQATVTVTDKTAYRRYAPDSVKFADAKVSKLDEISVGDQLRSRGQKSEDGLKVTADDVVFGTFLTKAGSVTAVNADTKEITVKELGTNKPLTIKLTADSQLKQMPNMAAMPGGAPGGAPGAGGPVMVRPAPAAPGGGAPSAGAPPRPAGAAPDIAQMIERLPLAKLDDLKPGVTIVVSSTKGAKEGELTAITLLANADMLIQMATRMAGGGARPAGPGAGPSLSGLAMDIPAITP
ncbi:MAG TPA: hypothetical protein VGV35_00210, partial [Bryobacteraceae bacterium]|nr:hypothetical protein [Bryobacteraceae bacterium]